MSCILFSPDGKTLISASHDRRILLWDLTFLTQPVSQLLTETKEEFLLPYRESRFQPRFFAAITTAVEDLLREHGNMVPVSAVEEVLWKFRDTGMGPADMRSLIELVGSKSRVAVPETPGPTDLYSPADWKAKPARYFMLAAGEYFLSKKNVPLADRCFNNYFANAPNPQEAARDKASVAAEYLEQDIRSEMPLKLAQEAAAEDPSRPWHQLVYCLALIQSGDTKMPVPILKRIAGKFEQGPELSAYNYAVAVTSFSAGQTAEAVDLLKKAQESARNVWDRKAAAFLRQNSQNLPATAPAP